MRKRIFQEYAAFTENIKRSGHFIGGNQLKPASAATTIRVRDGKVSVTDGPFAETKEQFGGYYSPAEMTAHLHGGRNDFNQPYFRSSGQNRSQELRIFPVTFRANSEFRDGFAVDFPHRHNQKCPIWAIFIDYRPTNANNSAG